MTVLNPQNLTEGEPAMTDTDAAEHVVAHIDTGDNLTVTVSTDAGWASVSDHHTPPAVELEFAVDREGLSLVFAESLTEEAAQKLIDALSKALADGRARAKARGFYDAR